MKNLGLIINTEYLNKRSFTLLMIARVNGLITTGRNFNAMMRRSKYMVIITLNLYHTFIFISGGVIQARERRAKVIKNSKIGVAVCITFNYKTQSDSLRQALVTRNFRKNLECYGIKFR